MSDVGAARSHGRPATVGIGASARIVRLKTSDAVAEQILEMIFSGELRPGDRLDLNALASRFDVSRAPVREALLALEADGMIEMPFHRGAFVARFDAATIDEAFDLYALLSALTSGRAAASGDPALLDALTAITAQIEQTSETDTFETYAREFRRLVNVACGGPQLRALMRTFTGLLPAASRLSITRSIDDERVLIRRELDAIRRGDACAAREITIDHIRLLGDQAVQTLVARGVIEQPASAHGRDDLLAALAALEPPRRP